MLCDEALISVKAGNGGDGIISFRQDAITSKGGPDGGDGGDGGNIIFRVNSNLNTLNQFLRKKNYFAQDGAKGGKQNKTGKDGEDLIIEVPIGTIIYEATNSSKRKLIDLINNDQEFITANGGKGGFGNTRYKSSVRRTPRKFKPGQPGEEKEIFLELKLIADIGLVGLPNSGKSTLISVLTKARPKIADYPFTTLSPNLGVLNADHKNIIIADIPGLISGASQGRGLGIKFLKHIERTKIIVHLIDIDSNDIVTDFHTISTELNQYNPELLKKPTIICLTKIDTLGFKINSRELNQIISKIKKKLGKKNDILAISSATHQGINNLIQKVLLKLSRK